MAITQLKINNFRLIEQLEIAPAPGLNMIWGANGSGKTSVLEAIYLLARGRSFRKSDRGQLIRRGEKQLSLFISTKNETQKQIIGLIKQQSVTQARLNGKTINRMSDLARALPLTVITPNSHEILERGPQYRRRFLDWGVFHVEQNFRQTFERFARCLKQRNAALRQRGKFNHSWDRELIESGNAVNNYRENYYKELACKIKKLSMQLLKMEHLQVDWVRGWSDNCDLEQTLDSTRKGDMLAGYTRYGPHRADLSIQLNKQKVEKVASRGQQKMLVVAMHLAQVELASELAGTDTIILIDDLTSELDHTNRQSLLEYLQQMGNQTIITGVDNIADSSSGFSRVFHVEQGIVAAG